MLYVPWFQNFSILWEITFWKEDCNMLACFGFILFPVFCIEIVKEFKFLLIKANVTFYGCILTKLFYCFYYENRPFSFCQLQPFQPSNINDVSSIWASIVTVFREERCQWIRSNGVCEILLHTIIGTCHSFKMFSLTFQMYIHV